MRCFSGSGVSRVQHKGQLCDFISSLWRTITYITQGSSDCSSSDCSELEVFFFHFFFSFFFFYSPFLSHHYIWRAAFFFPFVTVRCSYKNKGPGGGSPQMGHLSPWPPGGRWENTVGCQSGLRAERRREESQKKKKWVLMGEGCAVTFLWVL